MILNKSYPSSPNACYDDFLLLGKFKERIDSLKFIVGNTSKTSITPNQLKQMEIDYQNQKKLYESSECMNNFEKNKCEYLYKRITSWQGIKNINNFFDNDKISTEVELDKLNEEYKKLNCDVIFSQSRTKYVSSAINVFNTLDKKRIESDSIYERNKRIFFGGIVLILGIFLIMDFKKK
jgi:hypothetical protein